MFALNEPPTRVAEAQGQAQASSPKQTKSTQSTSTTSTAAKGCKSSASSPPFATYTFDSPELAPLLIMVQELPNYPTPTTTTSPNNLSLSSNPQHTSAFAEAPVTTICSSGSAAEMPKEMNLAMAPRTTTPGHGGGDEGGEDSNTVSDVQMMPVIPLLTYGRVVEVRSANLAAPGGGGSRSPAMECQTTVDDDEDCHIVSDGESDCSMLRNARDNNYPQARQQLDYHSTLLPIPTHAPLHLYPFTWSPIDLQLQVVPSSPLPTPPPLNPLPRPKQLLPLATAHPSTLPTPPQCAEEDRRRLKAIAFDAAFPLETHRCIPTTPCERCLEFFQTPVPWQLHDCYGNGGAMHLFDGCLPVHLWKKAEQRYSKPGARHGPKSKSSEFRGVTFYKRTGRWEAHIWYEGSQAYLGASATKEDAARAYDQAALMLYGPRVDTNFRPESYRMEMLYLHKLSKEQLVIYLRRDSRGYGAQASYPGVKHVKNYYQAVFGTSFLGTFATEEEAARAVYKEAVRDSYGALASLIIDTHHVRNMPSYAALRFAALHPEVVEATQRTIQTKTMSTKRPSRFQRPSTSNCTSSLPKKLSDQATNEPIREPHSTVSAAEGAIAAPNDPDTAHQLARVRINYDEEQYAATPIRRFNWGLHVENRRRQQSAACINPTQEQHQNSSPDPPSSNATTNPPVPQLPTQLKSLLPKFIRAPAAAATTASSSCDAASAPPVLPISRESSTPSIIKFKLFNVEICVTAEPGHGDDTAEAREECEAVLGNDLTMPPKKRCKGAPIRSPQV